jgi:polysaccharide biosynthesis protein PslE
LKALNQSELRMAQLERDAELARGKYMQYANSFEEARMDLELAREGISNLSVVQPPSLQERPVSPSKTLVGLGSLLLAVFGTAALVLTSERLNGSRPQDAVAAREAAVRSYAPMPEAARQLEPALNGG